MALGFGAMIVVLAAVLFVGLKGLDSLAETYDEHVVRINEAFRLIERIEAGTHAKISAVSGHLLSQDPEYKARFQEAAAGNRDAVAELKPRVLVTHTRTLVDLLEMLQEQHDMMALPLFDTPRFEPGEAEAYYTMVARDIGDELTEILDFLLDYYEHGAIQEVEEMAANAHAEARKYMLLISAFAIVVGVSSTIVITRTVARPIGQVAALARRLAAGDFTVEPMNIGRRPLAETEDLANAFNEMTTSVRQLLGQVQSASEALLDNGRKLLAAAEESGNATGHIAAAVNEVAQGTNNQVSQVQETERSLEQLRQAIDQIASGAQEQSERAQQTSRSLESMTRSIDEVSDSAQAVADASKLGSERAAAGGDAVGNVAEGMERIRTSSARVAERIEELGGYSRQIGQILQMIGDVAEQTNLLALNAAIEAARAGEHGRGFGVVAEEVRTLAEQSASSTREIGQLIGNIQAAVDAAVTEMQVGTAEVENGTELVSNAQGALAEIIAAIDTTDELARTISAAAAQMAAAGPDMLAAMAEMAGVTEENTAATQQMAASSGQVLRAMDEVGAIAEETAAATEEVSASAEEVNATAEDMKSAVQTLTDMAATLDEVVSRFRV